MKMNQNTQDFYSCIDDAPSMKNDNWVRPGRYKAVVTAFSPSVRHDGEKFQKIEYKIVEVLREGEESHGVGEVAIHMLNMKWKKNHSRVKHFVSVISNLPQSDITSEKVAELADNPDLIQGIEVIADAHHTTTTNGGKFTVVDYFSAETSEDQPVEEVPF